MRTFIRLALRGDVVRRALAYAIVVGAILIAINHGDQLFAGDIDARLALKLFLTPLVPFCVSTFSSVGALGSVSS